MRLKLPIVAAVCIAGYVSGVYVEKAESAQTLGASWYGEELRGSLQANGKPFNPDATTCAHKTLPLGTRLLVKHEGRGVTCEVTDRGPFVAGRDLDLSRAAADSIGLTPKGHAEVEVEEVEASSSTSLPKTGGMRLP